MGARDTLRLEVCYPLHGHELADNICALESGVAWVIAFDKPDFIGQEALLAQKEAGVKRKLVGLEVLDRGIVRDGAEVFTPEGEKVGLVASGTKPPSVNKAVALAFVDKKFSKIGTDLEADVRGRKLKVNVIGKPFYKR